MRRSCLVALSLFLCMCAIAPRVHAYGEAANGFPNWNERVLLEWVNRARSDPQADLSGCPSGNCAEAACYTTASPPRYLDFNVSHSSRYHSNEMLVDSFFDHWSECTLVNNIAALYLAQPQQCNGTASCACVGGVRNAGFGKGTDPFTRMDLFGASGGSSGQSEIIAAGYNGPDAMFYAWEYEPTSNSACGFHSNDDNGHRYIILFNGYGQLAGGGYLVGGAYGTYATMDFSGNATSTPKIPSGSHYPQQAASVDAWANWYDTAAPSVSKIDIDGVCSSMTLARGTSTNGAWHLTVSNVGTGCHHYVFAFKDSGGNEVIYPTKGALTIGDGSAQCPDYSLSPPPGCTGFDRIFANGFEP